MPVKSPMLRFLFGHGVIGGGVGIAIGGAFLLLDVAGLATLSMKSEPVWLGPFLLCFSFFASFSGLAMGVAIMHSGGGTDGEAGDNSGGGEMLTRHRLVPEPEISGRPAAVRPSAAAQRYPQPRA